MYTHPASSCTEKKKKAKKQIRLFHLSSKGKGSMVLWSSVYRSKVASDVLCCCKLPAEEMFAPLSCLVCFCLFVFCLLDSNMLQKKPQDPFWLFAMMQYDISIETRQLVGFKGKLENICDLKTFLDEVQDARMNGVWSRAVHKIPHI